MKKCIALVLSCLLLLSLPLPLALADDEVPEGYTPIYTTEDLDNIRLNMSGKYILMADLAFTDADYVRGGDFYNSGKGWEPIGTTTAPFNGELDGNGHKITNLIVNTTAVYTGLFGYANSLTVKNLTLSGSVTGGNYFNRMQAKNLYTTSRLARRSTRSPRALAFLRTRFAGRMASPLKLFPRVRVFTSRPFRASPILLKTATLSNPWQSITAQKWQTLSLITTSRRIRL